MAKITCNGYPVRFYDDGAFTDYKFYALRDTYGLRGICRARSWEQAYEICQDEFFDECDLSMEEIVKEYGFKREHVKIVCDNRVERPAVYPEDYPNGRLSPKLRFSRWQTIETPDPEAWADNELFQEAFGFRPNGPNARDTLKHGIYARDLNGECLSELTLLLASDLGIDFFDIPSIDD